MVEDNNNDYSKLINIINNKSESYDNIVKLFEKYKKDRDGKIENNFDITVQSNMIKDKIITFIKDEISQYGLSEQDFKNGKFDILNDRSSMSAAINKLSQLYNSTITSYSDYKKNDEEADDIIIEITFDINHKNLFNFINVTEFSKAFEDINDTNQTIVSPTTTGGNPTPAILYLGLTFWELIAYVLCIIIIIIILYVLFIKKRDKPIIIFNNEYMINGYATSNNYANDTPTLSDSCKRINEECKDYTSAPS